MSISGLVISYVLLALLGLVILLKIKLPLWVKFLFVVLMTSGYFFHYLTLKGFIGWPSDDDFPEHFEILAAEVTQPNRSGDDAGAIYFWLREADDASASPRAYQRGYSREMHKKVVEVKKGLKAGKRQFGYRRGVKSGGSERGGFYTPQRKTLPPK